MRKFLFYLFILQGVDAVSNIKKAKNATYDSSNSIRDMQSALSKVVDEELIDDLKNSTYYSIMLDESTDRSTEKTLMVYVKYIKSNVSVTRFLSVIELSNGTADCIFNAVKELFNMFRLDFSKCISISTDGASVMTGIRSGVTTRFSDQFVCFVCWGLTSERQYFSYIQTMNMKWMIK